MLNTDTPKLTSAAPPLPTRVMVVDDNHDGADMLAMLFASFGCKTISAYDGQEALCCAASFRPDVVLLDLDMPEVDGYETARMLRSGLRGSQLLLVAVSGEHPTCHQLATAAGFDFCRVKPVDGKCLHAEVMDALASLRGRGRH